MKLIPSSKDFATHASASSSETPPPYVSHEPRQISETCRSLEPSCLNRIAPTLSVSVTVMPQLNAIGIVAADLERTIRFYRLLGVDVPEATEDGHIDALLQNGARLMFDREDVIRSFRPEWKQETGNQISLAFECAS